MMRLYRLLLLSFVLFTSVLCYGQIPTAHPDNAATDEEVNITFNVTDNDTEILLAINPASVDLDVSSPLTIQNSYSGPEGAWTVNASGDVTYVPAPNFSGTAQISYTVRNTLGVSTNQALITVEVTEVNDLPQISAIANQTTEFNTATDAIDFTIADVETDLNSITLAGTSNNPTLVPDGNIAIAGAGVNRTVTVTPVNGESGSATIRITADDGTDEAFVEFELTVEANTLPTITDIGPQSTMQDTPVGPVSFTIGDAETPVNSLTVSGSSSNTSVVLNTGITFGGTGEARTVTITPIAGQSGPTTITITVDDGYDESTTDFVLTVNANTAPTISAISPQSTAQDTPTDPIAFTIDDAETAAGSLTVAGTSSNPALIPNTNANITLGGSGGARNVILTPASGQSGSATITITVSDGVNTTSTDFELTVTTNEDPTISAIGPQSTAESTATDPISFTIGDAETPLNSLALSASSSNTSLVPVSNISFAGTGAARTVTITPIAGASGTSNITITVSDGANTASSNFVLTVTANDAPTISVIGPQSTAVNTTTEAIEFTIGDTETPVNSLTVSGTSSNVALVSNSNIQFAGSGANRTTTITPTTGQTGTATITITVSDGVKTASTNFVLTVVANQPPTISAIDPQSTAESTPTGPISFTIGDAETPVNLLTVTASSSNVSLVPNASISLQGNGANRTVTIAPGESQSGNTTITITVDDGTNETSVSFVLTVNPVNDSPTITPIENQTTAENTPTEPIPFTIGDAETPAADLIVSATSSNTTIVPTGGITFEGTGSERTVTVTPAAGQSGIVSITIFVSDQSAPAVSTTFTLTVSTSNDPPTITAIDAQTINEDASTPALPFTIGDPDTALEDLVVSASSSDKTLIPDANIALFGTGISRTVTITPASNQTGVSTITLSVRDDVATVSTTFQVTVVEANDPPIISPVGPQTTSENVATVPIPFKVSDLETVATDLTVTASSSNVTLVPNAAANLTLAGSGEDRTIVITPAPGQSGDATITLVVNDGTATASSTFMLTVTSVNDPPTITAIQPQTTSEDVATTAISFTLTDAETAVGSLTVTGSSSDKELVPDGNIVFSTGGATRSVIITPGPNENGPATITLTVTDSNGGSAQTTFTLTVTPVNDPPTITAQEPLTTPESTPLALTPLNFTIVDPDNGENDYSIIIVKGSRYIASENIVTPLPDFFGELEVIVKVSDGKLTSPDFPAKILVTDVNSAPVIIGQSPDPIKIPVNGSIELNPGHDLIFSDEDGDIDIKLIFSEGDNYTLSGADLTTITPLPDYKGPLEVPVRASDGKAIGPVYLVKIDVFAPSALPTITGQVPLVIEEDHSLTLKFEDLIVSDTDSDYSTGFTMNIQPGSLYSVNNNQITPALNYSNGFLTVKVSVNDGLNPSNVFDLRIYVTPVNDAPEITVLESDPVIYEPGTGPVPVTQTFECEDVDSEYLSFGEVGLIDSNYKPDNDELIFEAPENSPIRGVYDSETGVLSLIGYAKKQDYIAAVRSVQYNYRLTLDANGEQSEISTAPKKFYINLNDGQMVSENKERAIELETSVELDIPNAFTPNGDETNDTWAVKPVTKTDQFNETILRVYNKRGLLVYEAVGLDNQWDGTYKGETLPVDTYYYTIDLKLSFIRKTFKGPVTILR